MPRRIIIALGLTLCSLASGVSATLTEASSKPAIVPGRSVLGVQLGASRARVVKLLGRPRRVAINHAFGTPETLLIYGGSGTSFQKEFVLIQGHVFQIVVHDASLRTARGIHVGSRLKDALHAYPTSHMDEGGAIRLAASKGAFTLFTALSGGTRIDGIIVAAALEP